jgi:hypothetical protein
VGNNLRQWHDLVAMVVHTRLNGAADVFVWGVQQDGQFSVKSMYNALIADTRVMFSKMLSLKIPLRIKIFMWYFKREVVLTKDNLARHNWGGGG